MIQGLKDEINQGTLGKKKIWSGEGVKKLDQSLLQVSHAREVGTGTKKSSRLNWILKKEVHRECFTHMLQTRATSP